MLNFLLILLCLGIGLAMRASGWFPETAAKFLNSYVIRVAFPALVLVEAPALLATRGTGLDVWIPISMAWLLFLLAAFFISSLGRIFGWSKPTIGALILTSGLGNTSFVGFPLLLALLGPAALAPAVLIDQAGSFAVLATAGVITASLYAGTELSPALIAKRVFLFPPFLALLFGLLAAHFGARIPDPLLGLLEALAATLAPVALVAVGLQLRLDLAHLRSHRGALSAGLTFKLAVAPLVMTALYLGILGSHSFSTRVTILESGMAPMITAAILASEFELDSELSQLMVGLGIPLSLITVPAWNLLLSAWF